MWVEIQSDGFVKSAARVYNSLLTRRHGNNTKKTAVRNFGNDVKLTT